MTIESKKACNELLESYHNIHNATGENSAERFITESSMLDTLRHMVANGDTEEAVYVLQQMGEPKLITPSPEQMINLLLNELFGDDD